jgi:hypothetical protein
VKTNAFSFIISWATNRPVVVEACTSLASPIWSPLATNPLSGGTSLFQRPRMGESPASCLSPARAVSFARPSGLASPAAVTLCATKEASATPMDEATRVIA